MSAPLIEGYAEIERIGRGGVGVVYRTTRLSTGRVVAIKVLRDISDKSVAWHRTRRELSALVALAGHANVIQLFDVLDLEHGPALVMEYAPGGSIADLLERRDDVLGLAETVLIGQHTAAALSAAHARGIVHRDIKPQNLVVDAYGQIKLCDFGISLLTRTEGFGTRTDAWSMRYASPEDLDGDVEVGSASDVYSLGATLLHVAHGAPPSLKDRLVEWVPPAIGDPQRAEFDAVLASCLHPRPDQRPSADELVERFERLGWALDERCRALSVDRPAALDSRLIDGRQQSVDLSEPVCSTPGLVVAGTRPSGDPSARFNSDETVLRAGRRPPPRPSVRPQPRHRWTAVAAGLAIVVAFGLGVLVWWPSGPSGSRGAASSTTIEIDVSTPSATEAVPTVTVPAVQSRPPTTVAIVVVDALSFAVRPDGLVVIDDASVIWPFGAVGECLVQSVKVAELQPVSCQKPHDLQRIAVAELGIAEFPTGSTFDTASVQAAVDTACEAAFDSVVGPKGDVELLDLPVTRPSAASWERGDRRFQCLLGVPQRRIIGDAAGAIELPVVGVDLPR